MTKLKSKKMTKSTFAVIIMAIAMVAMLAFGGTYAYFTATAKDAVGSVTMGKIQLTSAAAATFSSDNVFPGDTILDGGVTLDVEESTDEKGVWVAVKVTLGGDSDLATALGVSEDLGADWIETSADSGIFIYKDAVTDNVTVFGTGIEVDLEDFNDEWIQDETTGELNDASEEGYMGASLTLTIEARALQVTNVEDIEDAKTVIEGLFA